MTPGAQARIAIGIVAVFWTVVAIAIVRIADSGIDWTQFLTVSAIVTLAGLAAYAWWQVRQSDRQLRALFLAMLCTQCNGDGTVDTHITVAKSLGGGWITCPDCNGEGIDRSFCSEIAAQIVEGRR